MGIREDKVPCWAGGGWWQDKAPLIAVKMEKQMQRGGKSFVAGDSKYSKVLSLLGHWCHVETTRLTLMWELCRWERTILEKTILLH